MKEKKKHQIKVNVEFIQAYLSQNKQKKALYITNRQVRTL